MIGLPKSVKGPVGESATATPICELYFRIINTILFSGNEAELRESMRQLEKKTPLDEYFTYGYGARHLWVCQRCPSDKTKIFEHRIMMVEFQ